MARRSILLLVAVLIAALGTALIVIYVRGIDERAREGQELVEVLTATETIATGESMQDAQAAGKITTSEVTVDSKVDGALSSGTDLRGQVALNPIYPGEQIIAQMFGEPGEEATLPGLNDGQMAISVELTNPAKVANFVTSGSQVAIFVSADPVLYQPDGSERKLPAYTQLLLPRVTVVGVGDTTVSSRTSTDRDQQTTEEVPRTILTIAVDQEQAERVIYGARNGDLSFALLADKAAPKVGPGVTANDVIRGAFP